MSIEYTLTDFIKDKLYPALFPMADRVFPEYKLKPYKGGWGTSLKLDKTQSAPYRPDKCIISTRIPNRIKEQGGDSKDLLTLFMEENGYNSFQIFDAVTALCNTMGIEAPENNFSEKEKERREQVEERERLLTKMKRALSDHPSGAEIIAYLRENRGYTEDYISKLKEWGIGCLTPDIAQEMSGSISRSMDICKHTLAIPYYSRGNLLGFIFRDITGTLSGGDKYRFTFGLEKRANLFGLTGLKLTGNKEKDRTLTIVEGQFDALHAQLEGLENVVATGGVNLSTEALETAKKMGVERVVLILDTEENEDKNSQRDRDRAKALRTIHAAGLEGFIVTLPSDGGKTDVDSYLNNHSISELEAIIETAESAPLFLYRLLEEEALAKYNAQEQKELWAEQNISDFKREVLGLISDPITKPTDRDRIYQAVSDFSQGMITREAIKEEAETLLEAQAILRHEEETKKLTHQAEVLAKAGKAEEALKLLQTGLPKLSEIRREAEFTHLLAPQTEADFIEEMRKKKEGLQTPYTFERAGEQEPLLVPSGALTLVCAPTSHGKSTLLQNLALHTAQDGGEGAVLYFTFEEEASSVKIQMLNKYLNVTLTTEYKHNNNLRTLSEYYRTGSTQFVKGSALERFQTGSREFFSLLNADRIRIYRENYGASRLRDAINYLCKQMKVKAVFIDYIQLLRLEGYKGDRRSELCNISDLFNNLAIDRSLPIVMAAQLNRDAASPLEMHNQNIADSADIERYANTIIMLWNSSFKETTRSSADKKELAQFQTKKNFSLGIGGKVYAKLTKNRGGAVGLEAVLAHNGNTGVISQPASSEVQTSTNFQKQTSDFSRRSLLGETDNSDSPF